MLLQLSSVEKSWYDKSNITIMSLEKTLGLPGI